MPRNGNQVIEITKEVVDGLEPVSGRQAYYRDAELSSFGPNVRATVTSHFA